MSNILITSAGRRVSLVRAFKNEYFKINPKGNVYVSDFQPNLSAAAQIVDRAFKTCKIDDDNYIELLLKICLVNNIKLIVPTIDTELKTLSKNRLEFLKNGITIVLSDSDFIAISDSKIKTKDFFDSLNVRTAQIYDKKDYKLPLFIKPVSGSGSKENFIIENKNQLSQYHLEKDYLQFFEYLDHDIYDEYTCDLYYDQKSNLKCVIPRKRIEVREGEVSKAITCKNYVKTFIEKKFSKIDGVRGCLTLQVFFDEKTNSIIGIEFNSRFGGGYPLSYLAGGNYPKWIIEEYLFKQDIEYFDEWESDLLMLRYDDEILIHND